MLTQPRRRITMLIMRTIGTLLLLAGDPTSGPATAAASDPWRVDVLHPSGDPDGLYRCVLAVPADYRVNDKLGFTLVLVDRQQRRVGIVPLGMGGIVTDERWLE